MRLSYHVHLRTNIVHPDVLVSLDVTGLINGREFKKIVYLTLAINTSYFFIYTIRFSGLFLFIYLLITNKYKAHICAIKNEYYF